MKNFLLITAILFIIFPEDLIAGKDILLPSREAKVVMPILSEFDADKRYDYVESVLGHPEKDTGSGIFVFQFKLNDGRFIIVGTPDKKEVWYINCTGNSAGDYLKLYEKTEQKH